MVLSTVAVRRDGPIEAVPLVEAAGRVLARAVAADRDYPPLARSARDGFAVRSVDTPGALRIIGEIRAGEPARIAVHGGEAVAIMTGAPLPDEADAVVMIEHVRVDGVVVHVGSRVEPGLNYTPGASEAQAGGFHGRTPRCPRETAIDDGDVFDEDRDTVMKR